MKEMNIAEVAGAVKGNIIHGSKTINISSVSTNSKEVSEGALFVPIIGEQYDAHDFIEDAYKHGALACLTSKEDIYHEGITCIQVEDTLVALQDLARYYRNQFNIPIIGITGSVGKTSTKEMISGVLSTRYNVLKTAGNMNSQIGLPLMMFRLEEEHDIAVIEMGISEEGEMDKLVSIAQPNAAIVTNIGVSHIGQLKTKENIRKEKLKIINEFNKESILFINGNDPLLEELLECSQKYGKIDMSETTENKLKRSSLISFGTKGSNDYHSQDIKTEDGKTYFTLVNSNTGSKEDIVLPLLGEHNVNNALCALAVARAYNIPMSIAKKGIEDYQSLAMRGEIKKAHGITIIDDTYNASPDSMKSGIEILLSLSGVKRRIAVLADILELGSVSKQIHTEVGEFIASKNIDELITIGQEAKYIAEGVNSNKKNIITHSFDNNSQAIKYLEGILTEGDAILVKGSRGMKTEEIVQYLLHE